MSDTTDLVRAFEIQSGACAAFGSPFSAGLLEAAAKDVAAGGPLVGLLAPWQGRTTRGLVGDAAAIRWLGCLHDLVLSGEAPELAAAYPMNGRAGDLAAAWTAARAAMVAWPGRFAEFMSHEPQTNEVRRSACLLPGFLTVAAKTGLPMRLFEIGASAGLNQLWDRYRYGLGEVGTWGDAAAAVRLDAEWRGPAPPLDAPVRVVSRAACDRKPVDIRDPIARRRLKAYVWADQFERIARLETAVDLALETDTRVEAEDAVTWVARRAAPREGAVTVIYHSIFWQYMPAESQAAVAAAITALGATARPDAPLAWLRMEPPPGNMAVVELRLTAWPGGEDRLLGHAHPHGASVDWEA
jgi:hypothetical protein